MYNILSIFLISSLIFSSSINDRAMKRINKLFPNIQSVNFSKHILDLEKVKFIEKKVFQNFYSNELYIWEIDTKSNDSYIAILDNVKGKSMPITYLAIFNSDNSIHDITIIKYREPYGGEIKSKRWLKQFIGLDSKSDYSIGKSLDGISGATISTNSLARGVNRLSYLLELYNLESFINE